ncbi:hypothetical protein SNEBB_001308 [Seison nebaliae]|nr:hypothetical protein SNEBB_001308 [Seison nebaliae]
MYMGNLDVSTLGSLAAIYASSRLWYKKRQLAQFPQEYLMSFKSVCMKASVVIELEGWLERMNFHIYLNSKILNMESIMTAICDYWSHRSNERIHEERLKESISLIHNYYLLKKEVEQLCSRKVTMEQHGNILEQLWIGCKLEKEEFSQVNPKWSDIGFQGNDPLTDFRSVGLLGLLQLKYVAYEVEDKELMDLLLKLTNGPIELSLPFAICGMNVSGKCVELLNENYLKKHFYNKHFIQADLSFSEPCEANITVLEFHQIYHLIFAHLANTWEMRKIHRLNFEIHFNEIISMIKTHLESHKLHRPTLENILTKLS